MEKSNVTYCGFVAIIGRPNVGKSTLLNAMLGHKVSITSHKPQTTRHRLLGIKTVEQTQLVFVDTPGLQSSTPNELNKFMNDTAFGALVDTDVVLFMVEAMGWRKRDEWVLERLSKKNVPVVLGINKVDLLDDKAQLLPYIQILSAKYNFSDIVPFSAEKREGVDQLIPVLSKYIPESPWYFPKEQTVDREAQFIVSEFIREKLMRFLSEEIPYSLAVTLEKFERKDGVLHVSALIWVDKKGQKGIVIGKGGSMLKIIGTKARESIERYLHEKVFLQLWVKVKSGWADDPNSLKQLGYDADS